MPVNTLLGVPGSGKSYEAVAFHIIPALEDGRKVVTNLPLNLQHFEKVYGKDILKLIRIITPTAQNSIPFKNISDWNDDWKDEETGQACLFVVDECHRPLPRGGTSIDVEEWFAEHRHKGYDVLLITQSYGKVSKSICDIIHIVYRVRKNIALGSSKSYIRKVQDGLRGEVVNTAIRKYDPKYFPFYQSHTQSNKSIDEAFAKDIIPIWRNWTFIGALILIPLGLYFLLSRPMPFNQVTNQTVKPLTEQIKQAAPNIAPVSPQVQPQPELMQSKTEDDQKISASHPFYKLQMHIGGFLESEDKKRFMYNILLSQNGQVMSTITDKDLLRAGYSVEAMGSCVFKVSYKNYYDYIICDSPRISPNTSSNFNNDAKKT